MRQKRPVPFFSKGKKEQMETIIIAGGEMNQEELMNYCDVHKRTKYNCR